MIAGLVLFDLLVGAAVAFGGALGLALLARRWLRLEHGRLAVLLLAVPLVKAGLALARGVPAGSFLWARLAGAMRERGTLRLGLGLAPPAVPVIDLSFGALAGGVDRPQSLADGLAAAWTRWAGPWGPALVGLALAAAALAGLTRWAVGRWRAARREASRGRAGRLVGRCRLGPRDVRLLRGDGVEGVPCAGGLLRPWIWLPGATWDALSPGERAAIIAHELAHLRWLDGPVLTLVGALRAAFGFVPGAAWLARRIAIELELAADEDASRATSATALASALVRVAERACGEPAPALPLALLTPRGALGERVGRLLGPPDRVRPRWARVGCAAGAWLAAAAVVRATLFGYP